MSTGSVLVDMTMRVRALPPPGGDVIATAPVYDVGGGYNLVYAAARQGAAVVYAGRHGTGPRGDQVRAALADLGVAASLGIAVDGDTGLCLTLVDDAAERTFVTAPGVEAVVSPADVASVAVAAGDLVAVSGYDLAYHGSRAALAAWVAGLASGVGVLVDPGPLVADIPADVWAATLGRTTVLTVNEREAALLAGEPSEPALGGVETQHAAVRSRNPLPDNAMLVIRHGANGCSFTLSAAAVPVVVPGLPVDAVDTTGAGDTHCGVLLAGLLAGLSPYDALHRANVGAALSVTRAGPATAPTRAEIDAVLGEP